jgi:hypothetical protein
MIIMTDKQGKGSVQACLSSFHFPIFVSHIKRQKQTEELQVWRILSEISVDFA